LELGGQVRVRVLVALALVAAAAAGRIAWQIGFDPETRFFSTRSPAAWVTEAIEPTSRLRHAIDREVLLAPRHARRPPAQATLRVRVHRAGVAP
jgi:hypothetical protein